MYTAVVFFRGPGGRCDTFSISREVNSVDKKTVIPKL